MVDPASRAGVPTAYTTDTLLTDTMSCQKFSGRRDSRTLKACRSTRPTSGRCPEPGGTTNSNYYASWSDHQGKRQKKCMRTTDKATAERIANKHEPDAAQRCGAMV